MNNDSPYKGILLYHGLGSGKTCTSITIAENLKKEKNIIIMLPASLKNNFIYKGILFCGDPNIKWMNQNINQNIHLYHIIQPIY